MKSQKGYKGIGMDGFIARMYDKNARGLMIGIYKTWAKKVSTYISDGDFVLEVAPGPGYLAIEISKLGKYKIVGLDISKTFVEIAQKNSKEAGVQVEFQQGDVAEMPFQNETFDIIICTSSFKNFKEPVKALKEMYRVLKPNGKAWIDDLRNDISDEAVDDLVKSTMKARGITAIFMKWQFKSFLKKKAYSKEQFADLISKTEFKKYNISENQTELEILLEKSENPNY